MTESSRILYFPSIPFPVNKMCQVVQIKPYCKGAYIYVVWMEIIRITGYSNLFLELIHERCGTYLPNVGLSSFLYLYQSVLFKNFQVQNLLYVCPYLAFFSPTSFRTFDWKHAWLIFGQVTQNRLKSLDNFKKYVFKVNSGNKRVVSIKFYLMRCQLRYLDCSDKLQQSPDWERIRHTCFIGLK